MTINATLTFDEKLVMRRLIEYADRNIGKFGSPEFFKGGMQVALAAIKETADFSFDFGKKVIGEDECLKLDINVKDNNNEG